MKNNQLKYGLFALVVFIFFVIGYLILITPGGSAIEGEFDDFASCLTEQGVIMYGTDWCSFCNRQKDVFESSFRNIKFIDCDKDRLKCQNAGVTGYPTWAINGENYPGLKSLEQLSEISGCKL